MALVRSRARGDDTFMRSALQFIGRAVRETTEVNNLEQWMLRAMARAMVMCVLTHSPIVEASDYSPSVPTIHPTAIIEGDVTLADDVVIGPWCHLMGTLGAITVGSGTVLRSRVQLEGPLTLGENNTLCANVCLGCAPQDLGTPMSFVGPGVIIGSRNVFREGVTVSRPKWEKPGRIGNDNYWMTNSHAGHDCIIGNNCIFGNGTLFAGHCEIADRVITGGSAGLQQFVRVGRGAFIGGLSAATLDVCPFFMVLTVNHARAINVIGMRRAGIPSASIDAARWAFKTLCHGRMPPKRALEVLRTRAGDPMIDEYISFIESSKRGIVIARGRHEKSQ